MAHDIDTALLRTFLALAETRNFSRTGERVGRSQSAVSAQVQKLEELLGQRLFERDKRNVHLTHAGEQLQGYARQMLQLTDAMLERFTSPDVSGSVRFASPEDFATNYLPSVLGAFSEAHPGVLLNVSCDLTLRLIAGLEADQYDLIVIKQNPDDLTPGSRRLWREHLVWVAGPRFEDVQPVGGPLFTGPPDAPRADTGNVKAKLPAPLPLVLSPPPCVYRSRAMAALDDAGIPWKVSYTSPSFAGTVAAVRAGLGVTALPRAMVPEGLVQLGPAQGWPPLLDAEMCLLAGERPNPATAALAEFIEQHAGPHAATAYL
jgi:DNA-binding transcriptional LysR family regulator